MTFRKNAHAIPESIGNRTLLSYLECDQCNQFFGDGIENDFGNWTLPMRTLARIRGKKRFPTIKQDKAGVWRIEAAPTSLNITGDDNPAFTVDEDNKQITLTLRRGDYTPIAVLKALVKMGLTILPEEELPNFKQTLKWIRDKDHSRGTISTYQVVHTFVPGPLPNNFITLMVWRRKRDHLAVPYATFVLIYANEMIQVVLPSPERDANITGKPTPVYYFPTLVDYRPSGYGAAETRIYHMAETSIVRGAMVEAKMSFEKGIDRRTV